MSYGRSLEIPRGRGSQKTKFLKETMGLNRNFQRSGGDSNQKPSQGRGMDIFSGTTQFMTMWSRLPEFYFQVYLVTLEQSCLPGHSLE